MIRRFAGAFLLAAVLGCSRSQSPSPRSGAAPGAPPLPQYTDVTAAAGIRFTHVNGAQGKYYVPETMGAGCAFLDFNGDGWLDILLLNDRPLSRDRSQVSGVGKRQPQDLTPDTQHPAPTAALYRSNQDNTFTEVTVGSGLDVVMEAMGCCVGDFDNDGREDLYITDALEASRLFRNETAPGAETARFRDVTAEAGVANRGHWGTSCAWLDYDRDGWLDLFVCNYIRYTVATDRPCYQSGKRYYCRPTSYPPDTCTLYRNLGASAGGKPRFVDVTRSAGIHKREANGLGVAVWDVDRDGWSDILVANDLRPNFLFHNQRDGTFQERGMEWSVALGEDGRARAGMGIDVADTRNNGAAAVLVSNFAGEPLSFFYQEDAPYFNDVTYEVGTGEAHLQLVGFGTFFFDYDNDGFKDIFVANGHIEPDPTLIGETTTYGQRNNLFRNRGGPDFIFEEVSDRSGAPFQYERVSRSAAYGDYDNDGDLDLLISNNGGPAELLQNDAPRRHHWLQIALRSRGSAIGAEVQVRANGQTQTDTVRSGSSYCSQSMLRLHFGLAGATRAEWVRVRWPGGKEYTIQNPSADQVLVLKESARTE